MLEQYDIYSDIKARTNGYIHWRCWASSNEAAEKVPITNLA